MLRHVYSIRTCKFNCACRLGIFSSLTCFSVINHICLALPSVFRTFICPAISNSRLHIELQAPPWLCVVKEDEAGLPAADLVGEVLGEGEGIQGTKEDEGEQAEEVGETMFVETFKQDAATLAQAADFPTSS